jgi:hypothetical protein
MRENFTSGSMRGGWRGGPAAPAAYSTQKVMVSTWGQPRAGVLSYSFHN